MTTLLKIKGREYDLERATTGMPINVLIYMKKRLGVTMKSIVGVLQQLNDRNPMDLFDDEEVLEAIRGLLWLVKTQAGERGLENAFLTLDEAADGIAFPADFKFINDEGDDSSPKGPELEDAVTIPS